jgi:osmoprotectant transport system ATP-binding protein
MPEQKNQICFEHVTKAFAGNKIPAVNDCSFEVEPGSFVVLLGPSGCGKTTLLKTVNRLYELDSGSIQIDGEDVRQIPVTQLRRRIGYVIQQVGLFPHLTIAENVAVVPELVGWPRARIDKRIDELLQLVNLAPEEYRGRYPAQLSGGQQQRVGLARALAADPMLLLMDEPFGAIDAITRGSLQEEMLVLHRRVQKTILFVTHDVDEALRLADRILVMRAGRVEQYGSPFELITNPANEFVAELLGAGDVIRRLSVMRVSNAMTKQAAAVLGAGQNGYPRIDPGASLREALAELLDGGKDRLAVSSPDGAQGSIGLDEIRRAALHTGPDTDRDARSDVHLPAQ